MIDDAEMRAWVRRRESPERAARILFVWDYARSRVPDAPLPIVSLNAGDDGRTPQLCWNTAARVVDVDVHDDGTLGWFTRDRVADMHDGSEDRVRVLPDAFFAALATIAGM